MLFHTAVIRSGYMMQNSVEFADQIETMLRLSMNVDLDEKVRVRACGRETERVEGESCLTAAVWQNIEVKNQSCVPLWRTDTNLIEATRRII